MNDITFVGRHTSMYNVSQHVHKDWEYVYCTSGSGVFHFEHSALAYQQGDVVIIPPGVAHANDGAQGFNNIHIRMASPILTLKEPLCLTDESNHFLLQAFEAAFFHYYTDRKERTALLSAYGNLICYYLLAYQADKPRTSVIDEIERHIISHYADCDFKLDDYMASLPLSDNTLRKRFRERFGVTPHQYLANKRLQVAADLLHNCGDTVSDIAASCGFRDPLYFSHMFKKKYGMSPSLYASAHPALSEEAGEAEKHSGD